MAPKTPKTNTEAPAVFNPSENDVSLMQAIDSGAASGNFRYVSSAEASHLVTAGLVIVNTGMLDASGNAAAQLTENGKKALPPMTDQTNAPVTGTATGALAAAAPAVAAPVTFAIANVAPPAIKRTPPKGGGQKPKYPQLDTLEVGQALFIPAPAGADTKKLSKQFGSMMSDRNSNNKDKFFTSRGIPDGKEAGFVGVNEDGTPNPEAYAGVAGTGLYRRPLDERKTRAPRKTAEQKAADAAALAASANAGTAGIPGTPGTDGDNGGTPPANV